MRGDALAVEKALDCSFGAVNVHLFPHQAVRHAVEVVLHLHVIIEVHPRLAPRRILVRRFWQGKHRRSDDLIEAGFPGTRKFAEGAVVEEIQSLPNGGVSLLQGEKGPVAQSRQDEALNDLHADLRLSPCP